MAAEVVTLTKPDDLETRALPLAEQARALQVVDQRSHDAACELLLGIKDLRKEAEDHHRPGIEASFRAWKANLAMLAKIDDPLKAAETVIKPKIGGWELEQKRLEDERRRKAEEDERKRREAELEAQLEQAEAQGASQEEIAAIIEQPPVVQYVAPPVAPTFQSVKGVSTRMNYRAECTDIKALCRAIADGQASTELVQPNMTALNAMARAMKTTMRIPGVRVVVDPTVAGGRR